MHRPRSSTINIPFDLRLIDNIANIVKEALLAYTGSTTSVHVEQIDNGSLKISIVEAVEYREA